MTVKPAALALLLALACKPSPSPPTVDAETTAAASPAPEPAAGASCFTVDADGSLHRVPCSPTLPRTPPTGSTPVAGLCCVPPDGPCLAVELASECPDTQDFIPCDWGYETVDANGMPTVVCFD